MLAMPVHQLFQIYAAEVDGDILSFLNDRGLLVWVMKVSGVEIPGELSEGEIRVEMSGPMRVD